MAIEGLPVVEELEDKAKTAEGPGSPASNPVAARVRAGANRRLGRLLARLGARVVLPPATASRIWNAIRNEVVTNG